MNSPILSFGAVGTLILVGVNAGVSADPAIPLFAARIGYGDWSAFLAMIGLKVALLHTIAGTGHWCRSWWWPS